MHPLPPPTATGNGAIDRTFDAILLDWDGTAVPDHQADATCVRERIEALCAAGVHVFVVSDTQVDNLDGQLRARPRGPGRLHLCLNRGSEVFEVTEHGAALVMRRAATAVEERSLDRAAAATVDALTARGLTPRVVSPRLNRRKIDLISGPDRASLAEVVELATSCARASGLDAARVTSDVKHVEIGLTDEADSARWAARWLAACGITGGLVLIAGDEFGAVGGGPGTDSLMLVSELARAIAVSVGVEPEGAPPGVLHEPGGPDRFLAVLDAQLARHAQRRVPAVDLDPRWVLRLPDAPPLERLADALGTLSNGRAGVRGAREEDGAGASRSFRVAGVYLDGTNSALLPGPWWCQLAIDDRHGDEQRFVDLHTGVLARTGSDGVSLRTLRFVSAANPYVMALRAEAATDVLAVGPPFVAPTGSEMFTEDGGHGDDLAWTGDGEAGVTAAARQWQESRDGRRVVERVVAWQASSSANTRTRCSDLLHRAVATGFDRLLADHRVEWADRWRTAEVCIDGDPEMEMAARFAVFHLLSAAATGGEAAVGARGLTGDAYGGHVFWDADVFVLPALAAMQPAAARAMLEYRIRRLPTARQEAASRGQRGARFPWESAQDGRDVTPESVRGPRGEAIPIRTGRNEIHIVADVAWAAAEYTAWSGDTAFLGGVGRDLVVDSARFWASRIRVDGRGAAHLYGVMGPDEYHETVDDNAYTNVMARWNLRRAASLVEHDAAAGHEARHWRALAAALVDGWDHKQGIYEQFAGYRDLEPLLVTNVGTSPMAADAVLGAKRVAGSQIIKQADVLMLHLLVPDEVARGSLSACLAYYEPRTAHGSSLSPAVYAALLARDGQPDRALELFRLAGRLDLDDITGTTAGGLHLATMGGLWQALARGFLGLRPHGATLHIDPHLPSSWEALSLRLQFRGEPIRVHADHDSVHVECAAPMAVRVGLNPIVVCDPPGRTIPTQRRDR